MSQSGVRIEDHMTPAPHSIGAEQTIATALQIMNDHDVRHLPVLHGGVLVGVVTERDIKLLEAFEELDVDEVTVEDAMTSSPFTVLPETPLREVVERMAADKYGSALVARHDHVLGIFTTVDACRVLADMLARDARDK